MHRIKLFEASGRNLKSLEGKVNTFLKSPPEKKIYDIQLSSHSIHNTVNERSLVMIWYDLIENPSKRKR